MAKKIELSESITVKPKVSLFKRPKRDVEFNASAQDAVSDTSSEANDVVKFEKIRKNGKEELPEKLEKPEKADKKKSPKALRRRRRRNILLGILAVFILVTGIIGFVFGAPIFRAYQSYQNISRVLNQFQADLGAKTIRPLNNYTSQISQEISNINRELDNLSILNEIAPTRGYYDNLQVIKQLSSQIDALLLTSQEDLYIILDSAGYTSALTQPKAIVEAQEPGQEVAGIIKELPRFVKLYEDKEDDILEILRTFNKLDPNYIPDIIAGENKDKIAQAQKVTADFPTLSAQLKDTLSLMPALLGAEKPANYLIVYQNEKEMRSSGGLLTAYGNLTVDKGEIGDEISATDMWGLENYVSISLGIDPGYRNIYGQRVLMNSYGNSCGGDYLRAQDSGIYPDLYVSLDMFKDYYNIANRYNKKSFPDYDHIIIVNTFFASDIISLVGNIEVDGQTLSPDNAAKLIFGVTSQQPGNPDIRKDFIGKAATAVKDKLQNLSTAEFPHVIQTIIRTIQAKNLALYSKNVEVQNYFDELGLSGRIEKNFAGDYFHLNEAQNCALKSNFYVYDTVTKNITINDAGDIRKDVSIEWVNEKLYDPAEEFMYSASFNYRYRAWIRLFMPQDSKVISTDGYEKSLWLYRPEYYFDKKMQKQVSDNVIYFDHRRLKESDPVRRHTLNVSYTLPANLKYNPENGYRLLLQKHPGKKAERYVININDKGTSTSVDFTLDRDKVLTYKDGIITMSYFDNTLEDYYTLMESFK